MCAEQRVSSSLLKLRRLLCLLRFLHQVHHRSIPIHRPLFYVNAHWSLAPAVPDIKTGPREEAHLYVVLIRYVLALLPFSISLLLWAPCVLTSPVSIHESVSEKKIKQT